MATDLLNSGMGDEGRLKFILSCIEKNKPLYKTDIRFLESMFLHGQQTSWLAATTIPASCIEAKTRDGSFDRAGRHLRYAVRPDGQLVSYKHPIMGEPTEHRFTDLVTPG